MLIILSGAETIHKKFFATRIAEALNNFQVDGYRVTFEKYLPTIRNGIGSVVYAPPDGINPDNNRIMFNDRGEISPEGQASFKKIIDMYERLFLSGIRDNHFAAIFAHTPYDFGVETELNFDYPEGYVHPHLYEDVVNNYKNRELENFVISGSFSKGFIDKIRTDLGVENVTVINITRNPSVCALIHDKPDAYYIKNSTYTKDFNEMKLSLSLTNNASLCRFDDITTIKFEDILAAGKFTVLDTEVTLPDGYEPYNEWLTQWEVDNVVSLKLFSADDLAAFNTRYQALASTAGQDPRMPENVFQMIGYTPMTIEEILSNGKPQ